MTQAISVVSPAPASTRSLVAEVALTIGLTIVLLIVGRVVLALALGDGPVLGTLVVLIPGLLGWQTLIWAALVAGIAVAFRASSSRHRAGLATVGAVIAVIAGVLITNGPVIPMMGGALPLALMLWGVGVLGFVACAAVGSFAAVALVGPRPIPARVWTAVTAILLILGGALTLALLGQWFDVYFAIWSAPVVTAEHGVRYLYTAGAALLILLAAVVIAGVRRMRAFRVIAPILFILALLFAAVLQVPQGRWMPVPESPAENSNYVPCFGEGDPNCVGG